MWGFWAGSHWRPWAALWDKDWKITPQGEAYRDLVYNRWWTRASGKTDKSGVFKTRAFFGEYEITVNGKKQKAVFAKQDTSAAIDVT